VCTGGRKNQLKASMLATDTASAYPVPQRAAIGTIASRYSTPSERSGATGLSAKARPVTAATANVAAKTPASQANRPMDEG